MIRKSVSLFIAAVILVSLFPGAAFAAGGTISAGGEYDLSAYGNDSTITIDTGLSVTLTNTNGAVYTNMQIICGPGVMLTIDGIKINNPSTSAFCPLMFNGTGNKLILQGASILQGGQGCPGIKCEMSCGLEISGEGSLETHGGGGAASIGGSKHNASGNIKISGGKINAYGSTGPGIGSGIETSTPSGTIEITSGDIYAYSQTGAAAIGGAYNDKGGSIIISGGEVSTNAEDGAGIGSGSFTTSAFNVNITGGIINSYGSGSGIGGSLSSPAGNISISGGFVWAKGAPGMYDIGPGRDAAGGSLSISGDAAVFSGKNKCLVPTTTTHTFHTYDTADNIYGIPRTDFPDSWRPPVYGWINESSICDLKYDINGGTSKAPPAIAQYKNTKTIIADYSGVSGGEAEFLQWNTLPDGTGDGYAPGEEYTFVSDTTLYAIYLVHVISVDIDTQSETVVCGDCIDLHAAVEPAGASHPEITWTSSNESVAVVDNNGRVTAVHPGNAAITAAADGKSDTCDITVMPKTDYSVSFDRQDGSDKTTVQVDAGSKIGEPERPERMGYTFGGWYKEPACLNPWSFGDDAVTDDITLYALWKQDEALFSGSGTQTNPYRITSAAELEQLSSSLSDGGSPYADKCFIQTQDIDLSAYANWTPIGTFTSGKMFDGTYDGNGNSIKNLNISSTSASAVYSGLFGYVGGTVKNLTIENGAMKVSAMNDCYIAGIAGCLVNGSIENCNVRTFSINASGVSSVYAGGVVGDVQEGTVSNCTFSGSVIGGGVSVFSGGIAGRVTGSDVRSCIMNCCNTGSVTDEGGVSAYAGGIVGSISSTGLRCSIEGCFNAQTVKTLGTECCSGGIVGRFGGADISDCFNTGNIISVPHSSCGAGGLIGYRDGAGSSVQNSYNTGYVQGYHCGSIAGINKDSSAFITNCYYLSTCAAAVGSGGGTANSKSLGDMKRQSTYTGFDFSSVWTLEETEETGYPLPQLKGNLFYPQPYDAAITADSERGSVQGAGSYMPFETVTITATPKEHYAFKNWDVSAGGAVIDNPARPAATFSMPSNDVSISAVFEKKKYKVEFEYDGTGIATGGGSYAWGETVSIAANAGSGSQFLYWDVLSGGAGISDESDMTTTFVMPKSDVRIKAVFGCDPAEFKYTVTDEKATITGYTGAGGAVEIPMKIGGYRVTAIGDWAFHGCNFNYVEIPDCVESIGEEAFTDCSYLSGVYIGSGVENIGILAFNRCYALKNFGVSEDSICYSSIDGVLYDKNALELVCYPAGKLGPYTIPQGVISIAHTAFGNCRLLTDISIPDSVTSIGESAFTNTGIKSVTIPRSVKHIQDYAFYICTSLENVVIGENVKYIGEYAFYGCSSIKQLYLPESLTAICNKAFSYCSQLSDVYFWGSRPSVFVNPFEYESSSLQLYYHISKAGGWADIGLKAFCVLRLELGGNLGNITLAAVLSDFRLVPPAPDPQQEDYVFAGWYTDAGCSMPYDFGSVVTGDVTLYAKWMPLKFSLTYDLDGGSINTPNPTFYRTTDGAITLRNPQKTGCTFAGWSGTGMYSASANVTIPSGSTGDRHYVAHWTANTYTITFNSKEGSSVPAADVKHGQLIPEPAPPTKPGYSFAGWYKESSCVNKWNFETDIVTASDTLYAKWTPLKFGVSYDLGGGSLNTPNPEYYSADEGAITLHNPQKPGHTFSGWSGTDISGVSANVTIPAGSTGDRYYTAHWTVNTYTITFNSKDGSYVPPVNAPYGSLIPEPLAPTRSGYSFAGWYTESSCVNKWDFGTGSVTVNDTLYAKWQPLSHLLDHIELSAGTMMKPFAKNIVSYNITLGEYEDSLTLVPVKEYDGAVMKINNIVRDSISISLANGKSATVKVSVSFNKKTKNYSFKVTRMKSSNNVLSSLTATAGSFDKPFDPNVLNYSLSLNEYTKNVTINAASAFGAGVSPSAKKLTLNNGDTKTVNITVKAQTGAKRIYVITVKRMGSTNADLKTLKTAPGLSSGFSPQITSYTVMLPANKGSVGVSAKVAGYKAAVCIDGVKKTTKNITVPSGQSVTIRVTVAAQAGNTKDYYITFTRPLI